MDKKMDKKINKKLLTVTMGNKKLPDSITIFNLPANKKNICIGQTKECKKYCYAKFGVYPNVKKSRLKNFKASKKNDFSALLKTAILLTGNNIIRFHESGDFYNQKYLDKCFSVAESMPEKFFFTYTKTTPFLDFSKTPKNFRTIDSLNSPGSKYKAYVLKTNQKIKKGDVLCPGSCGTCNICYNKKNKKGFSIAFKRHEGPRISLLKRKNKNNL